MPTSVLRQLGCRGCDSAAVVTVAEGGKATLLRAKGKVAELGMLVAKNETDDRVGIGHPRWATR